ncbi:restriction endonuclease subunit S [Rhodoferax sp. TBRC 17660]|uniref:Restriction endonuclease subunit S n=1 Tax=Rhodoferax potami TaxID=3068338 RepID=A0ABU3KMG8_9BURK|nr:restriction endonuclease subunit S [Rhodoferax sp. TBRC 17660]MDT7518994.1 restriction endonuclease subunit S [Rhodoferax sp. TBRC 17660]
MTARDKVPFGDLLLDSKDGEWGEGAPGVGLVAADMIRGTDFAELNSPAKVLPRRYVNEKHAMRKRLQVGDIVFEMAGGTAKQSTGRSALITKAFLDQRGDTTVLCASFCRHLRLDQSKYDPQYVSYVLQALYGAGYMAVFNVQHTGVSRFQYTSFKKHTVLVMPSLAVQQKIAAILSAYDDLIANNQRRITLLERMAEDIYREWFVRLRFPGHENVKIEKGVPQGWELASLASLGTYLNGYAFDPTEWFEEGIPIIKIREMTSGITAETPRNPGQAIPSRYHFGNDEIIFSWSATLLVKIWDQGPGLLNQHLFKVTPANGVSKSFLFFSIKFSLPIFESLTTGSTMKHIKRKELETVKVMRPVPDLIERFDSVVEPILAQVLQLTKANRELIATRDALLPRLISGKLSVDALDIRFPPGMASVNA